MLEKTNLLLSFFIILLLYMIFFMFTDIYAQYTFNNFFPFNNSTLTYFQSLNLSNNPTIPSSGLFNSINNNQILNPGIFLPFPSGGQYFQSGVSLSGNGGLPQQINIYQASAGDFYPLQTLPYAANTFINNTANISAQFNTATNNNYSNNTFAISNPLNSNNQFAVYQLSSPSLWGNQTLNQYNPSLTLNPVSYNPFSFSSGLNQGVPISVPQVYPSNLFPVSSQNALNYLNLNPIQSSINYLPYTANSNYYAAGISNLGSDIRMSAVPTANLVFANPEYGMYCWDPVRWLDGGYQVGIWCPNIPIRAQSIDKRGRLLDDIPSYTVQPTGETGIMSVVDKVISLYRGVFEAASPADYYITVKVDTVSVTTIGKRRNATCDACHPAPPGHISAQIAWGNCHDCHNLGDVLHRHAYKAGIAIDNCYRCHPSGCLSGAHGNLGIWCTICHGTLEDASNGQMGISGQKGKPQCADCHDSLHSEPGTALFVDSAGHGGIWCINCHGATHVELAQPVGLNNCIKCHTVQSKIPWMGPNCAQCHGSSYSPHLVTN